MLEFDDRGLIPAIIQDASSAQVLMLGYMNKEALKRTVASGDVWFYSRSRRELWHKGETSGNFLKLKSIIKDCDSDTLLIYAEPAGPVCHTGNRTCFFQQLQSQDLD
jgi:phosphoribosyl-AMP cyclohydrolase